MDKGGDIRCALDTLQPADTQSSAAGPGGAGCENVAVSVEGATRLQSAAVGCCWLQLAAVGCCWLLLAAAVLCCCRHHTVPPPGTSDSQRHQLPCTASQRPPSAGGETPLPRCATRQHQHRSGPAGPPRSRLPLLAACAACTKSTAEAGPPSLLLGGCCLRPTPRRRPGFRGTTRWQPAGTWDPPAWSPAWRC